MGERHASFFDNRLDQPVMVNWVDMAGGTQSYGRVAPGERRDQHTFTGHVWEVRGDDDKALGYYVAAAGGGVAVIDGREPRRSNRGARSGRGRGDRDNNATTVPSPDGQWEAFVKDHDLYVRRIESGEEIRLADHGNAEYSFRRDAIRERAIGMNYNKPDYPETLPHMFWSPDSERLIALKTTVVDEPRVYMVESSPKDQQQPKLHSYPYIKPGDPIPQSRPYLFDVQRGEAIPVDNALIENPWSLSRFEWLEDSSAFRLLYKSEGPSGVAGVVDRWENRVGDASCGRNQRHVHQLLKQDTPDDSGRAWPTRVDV